MDEAEVRRRMYRAPTPGERERWHAVWLLTQGLTAAAVGRGQGRDAHTLGQWAKAFAEGGPKALVFEQSGGSPLRWTWSNEPTPYQVRGDVVESGGAGIAVASGHRTVQLELESSAPICAGSLWLGAQPESACGGSELPAPAGVCAETAQEAVAQGGPGAAGSFRGRVCGADGGGGTDGHQDILRRRGLLSGGC